MSLPSLLVPLLCFAAGCVAVTSRGRLETMEEEIAALKEELRQTRGAPALEAGPEQAGTGEERDRLRREIALLDLELEILRENLGGRHAKTVDTQGRRDRLMRELLAMQAASEKAPEKTE